MKIQLLVTTIHSGLIIILTYLIVNLQDTKKVIFWVFWCEVGLSFILYILVAKSDPGRIKDDRPIPTTKAESTFHQQQSSLGSILTITSGINRTTSQNFNVKIPDTFISNPINLNIPCISERLNCNDSSSNSVSINLDIIPDDISNSLNIHPAEEENHLASQENYDSNPSNISQMINNIEETGKIKNTDKIGNDDKFEYLYCTVCFCDQPLRARHCKICGICVATFDHHCPFIGNCVGEKNKLVFFWYLFFQTIECWVAFYLCYTNTKDYEDWDAWCQENFQYILVAFLPFLLGILLSCLWLYHIILACKNWTTYEVLRWKDVYYLGAVEISPFDMGLIKNCFYYCRPYKKITMWRV
ncbi:hypothetical protein SteCoe_31438 [Stentor coeruleus]|uniref:Palmitoyltransferase n=1 Tax=Stentor coeruleus TaxID=5963 RepID=A0A1R2B1R2_9CILI|nr:hypothetical protein SteCoe_31438 [Stentor coeruleus]